MALTYSPDPDLGRPCPDFALPGTDGRVYSKIDFQSDHSLLVMFICNHCPYVIAIEDRLVQLAVDLKKIGVSVVAISSNDVKNYPQDSFDNMKSKAIDKKYPFVYLYDETQDVARRFGAVCTPDFFVYDRNDKLAYRGRLDDSWKDPTQVKIRELYQAVLNIEANQPIQIPQTPTMGCNIKWK